MEPILGAIEREAQALSQGLNDPIRPTICPDCFHEFFKDRLLNPHEAASVIMMRAKFQKLFNRMILFVATRRSAYDRRALNKRLLDNVCQRHRLTRFNPGLDHVIEQVLASNICLYLDVAITSGANHGFHHRVDGCRLWPTKRSQFFPCGADITVDSIIDWICYSEKLFGTALRLLAQLILYARQRTLAVVLAERNRTRILNKCLRLLENSAAAQRPSNLPGSNGGTGLRREINVANVGRRFFCDVQEFAALLNAVMRGNPIIWCSSSQCDEERFTAGYESRLCRATLQVVHILQGHRQQNHLLDLLIAMHRRGKLSRNDLPEVAILRLPGYIRDYQLENDAAMMDGTPYRVMLRYLRRLLLRVEYCVAPGCGRHSHESTPAHVFPVCIACGTVHYCSRECQARDWVREGMPHKEMCDILQEICSFSDNHMDEGEFIDACYEHHFPVARARRLTEWMAHGVPYRSCLGH